VINCVCCPISAELGILPRINKTHLILQLDYPSIKRAFSASRPCEFMPPDAA
jgi:hypothetical protein